MTNEWMGAGHLEDEDLVRVLDDETAMPERGDWSHHVDQCHACSERMQELRSASEWLEENVPSLDGGVLVNDLARARALVAARGAAVHGSTSRRLARPGAARIAAGLALVVAAGLTAEPVRAWVLDGAGRLIANFVAEPTASVAAPNAPISGPVVSFRPAEHLFRIELDNAQAAGALTIDLAPVDAATAQISAAGEESLSVLPAGLVVENSATSTASYGVVLPLNTVGRVQVLVAGRLVLDQSVGSPNEPLVVDLAGGSAPQ